MKTSLIEMHTHRNNKRCVRLVSWMINTIGYSNYSNFINAQLKFTLWSKMLCSHSSLVGATAISHGSTALRPSLSWKF